MSNATARTPQKHIAEAPLSLEIIEICCAVCFSISIRRGQFPAPLKAKNSIKENTAQTFSLENFAPASLLHHSCVSPFSRLSLAPLPLSYPQQPFFFGFPFRTSYCICPFSRYFSPGVMNSSLANPFSKSEKKKN